MKPTQKQVIEWAREAGLHCAKNYDYRGSYEAMTLLEQQDFDKTLLALSLAYEAGRKDENEACAKVCEDAIAFMSEFNSELVIEIGENVCITLAAAIRARRNSNADR